MGSYDQRAARERPLEWLGRLVEVRDERQDTRTQIVDGREAAAPNDPAYQNAEPHFDLIEPGCMRRRVHKLNAVGGVIQPHLAIDHTDKPTLCRPLGDLGSQATVLGHEVHQSHGLMNIQLVDDKHPTRIRIGRNRCPHMFYEIYRCTRRSKRSLTNLACRDLKADHGAQRAMSDVFKLAPLDEAWAHRLGRRFALQGLDPRQLVGAHDMHSERMEEGRVGIQGTNGLNVFGKGDGIRLSRVQPVPTVMGLELGLSLRTARLSGLKWQAQCRV